VVKSRGEGHLWLFCRSQRADEDFATDQLARLLTYQLTHLFLNLQIIDRSPANASRKRRDKAMEYTAMLGCRLQWASSNQ